MKHTALALSHSLAASCGFGLSLEFSAATIELNYVVPLVARSGIASPGFTFAVGADLL